MEHIQLTRYMNEQFVWAQVCQDEVSQKYKYKKPLLKIICLNKLATWA